MSKGRFLTAGKFASLRWRFPNDGEIMRMVFYGLVLCAAIALFIDYDNLVAEADREAIQPGMEQPILPPYVPPGETDTAQPGRDRPDITSDPAMLRQVMKLTLKPGGELHLTGTIDVGSANRFRDKIAEVAEYVTDLRLDSPGGSVADALAISQLVRDNELKTRVVDGALCASSCPIIFAGGVERLAGPSAAIGVHQIFLQAGTSRSPDAEISGMQSMTARVNRHLEAMGVDPGVWVHALETPPQHLYYLTPEELEKYKLATGAPEPASPES